MVTPLSDNGRVIGMVSAGITVRVIGDRLAAQLVVLGWFAAGALALGGAGTYVVNARLRRHTHGMNAAELSRMYDYHQAALHGVREGLLMLDGQRRITLINDAGRELLGLEGKIRGTGVADLGLPAPLTGALLADGPRVDEVHLTADRVLVVNSWPVAGGGRKGTVVTLRDHTELQSLTGELDHERGFTQALRSQAHEAANRLHTVVSSSNSTGPRRRWSSPRPNWSWPGPSPTRWSPPSGNRCWWRCCWGRPPRRTSAAWSWSSPRTAA
ncbi:hypothetical protein GCM10020254_13270 [Streptomyces goshikiensis]